jgi:cytoskeletal protein CcmA (bactofilin family)
LRLNSLILYEVVVSFWNNEKDNKETNSSVPNSNGKSSRPAEAGPTLFDKPSVAASSNGATPSSTDSTNPAQRYSNIRSALGPGTIIQGKLSFDTPVRIDGKLSGEVFSSEALIVGSAATLKVASLIIMGKVKGNIIATERIELLAGGTLEGEVTTPVMHMDEAAIFNGRCTMGAKLDKTTLAAKDAQAKATKAPSQTSAAVTEPAKRDEAVKPETTQPEAGLH